MLLLDAELLQLSACLTLMFRFAHRVVRSHLAHVLLAVSWTYILLVYVRYPMMQPQFVDCVPTGDEIYWQVIVDKSYPIWTKAIAIAHIPASAATVGATKVLQRSFSFSCAPTAKVEVPLFFAFGAIQWLLVGYTIESLFRRMRSPD